MNSSFHEFFTPTPALPHPRLVGGIFDNREGVIGRNINTLIQSENSILFDNIGIIGFNHL